MHPRREVVPALRDGFMRFKSTNLPRHFVRGAGESDLDTEYIPLAELAKAAGYSCAYLYACAQQDRDALPLDPDRRGVPLEKAVAWLKVHSRTAKKAARDKTIERLQAAAAAESLRSSAEAKA